MAGPGSFVLPANGYNDFGRAIRQKFVIEISGVTPDVLRAAQPRETARADNSGSSSRHAADLARSLSLVRRREQGVRCRSGGPAGISSA